MSVVYTQRNKLVLLNRKPKDFPPINRSPEKNTLWNANKPIQLWLSLENYVNIGTWLLTSQCKWLPIDNKLVQPLVNRLHRNLTPSFSPPPRSTLPQSILRDCCYGYRFTPNWLRLLLQSDDPSKLSFHVPRRKSLPTQKTIPWGHARVSIPAAHNYEDNVTLLHI